MRRLPAALLAGCLLLAPACSGSPGQPAATASFPVLTEPAVSLPSGVTAQDRSGYLHTLAGIAPALTDDQGRALQSGLTVCQLASSGTPAGRLAAAAREQFGRSRVGLTDRQAAAVVAAARRYLCPH